MQNFKFIGAMLSESCFFKEKIGTICEYFIPRVILYCMQLVFHMFSTLMSLEDRLI